MLVFTRSTGETQAGSRDPASFFAWAASLLADRTNAPRHQEKPGFQSDPSVRAQTGRPDSAPENAPPHYCLVKQPPAAIDRLA